jgi:monovalent cation:proton antiporter-2 (CPA2) family protein
LSSLSLVLLLLGASVLAVVVFRRFNLPPVLGYLLVGSVIGPHALNLTNDITRMEYLAEFGVVFLMFSIGLEFSLPKLYAMKRIVFGLGLLQVTVTMLAMTGLVMLFGVGWQLGIALGGVFAMSSTAVLTKLLSERMQLDSAHGREVMGVLLFQDIVVVPLLVVIPALTQPPEKLAMLLGIALLKAVVVLAVILVFGQRLMRRWFHIVARAKSSEVFILNVLLITLGLAYLTEHAGLSLALGAFVAGMLISETEYRLQVEEDIKPFRDRHRPLVAGAAAARRPARPQGRHRRAAFLAPRRDAGQCHPRRPLVVRRRRVRLRAARRNRADAEGGRAGGPDDARGVDARRPLHRPVQREDRHALCRQRMAAAFDAVDADRRAFDGH